MKIVLSLKQSPATPEHLLEFTLDLEGRSRSEADAIFTVAFEEARKLLKTAMDVHFQNASRADAS